MCDEELGIGPCEICERNRQMTLTPSQYQPHNVRRFKPALEQVLLQPTPKRFIVNPMSIGMNARTYIWRFRDAVHAIIEKGVNIGIDPELLRERWKGKYMLDDDDLGQVVFVPRDVNAPRESPMDTGINVEPEFETVDADNVNLIRAWAEVKRYFNLKHDYFPELHIKGDLPQSLQDELKKSHRMNFIFGDRKGREVWVML